MTASLFSVVLFSLSCAQRHDPPLEKSPGPRIVDFVPGVRIDYRVPQVEVDGEIILRQGQLELFAYCQAPVPKEHESIILVHVPAEAVYQALGLVGLRPGHPPRYDALASSILPATGDSVDIFVSYTQEGQPREVRAGEWMLEVKTHQPMAPLSWVFAGSRRTPEGAFQANVEGTLATIVDFDSSVLSLAQSHTSSDAELWLEANTDVIPPLGTKVTLVLRPGQKP